ncbi:hypothetical protein ACXET9_00215 [Brachybacterium sp. DNPG3]
MRAHKEQVEAILAEHVREAGADDPGALAEHLSFLLEGAMSRAGLEGERRRLESACRIAASLLGGR